MKIIVTAHGLGQSQINYKQIQEAAPDHGRE